jgi:hypothetical protein
MSSFHADEVLLQWQQVAAQQVLPSGLHGTEVGIHQLHGASDQQVMWLRSYVLADQGGETVTKGLSVTRKVKPRWLPRFLWNRFNEEVRSMTVTVEPKWTYPNATIKVPRLGEPVRIFVESAHYSDWDLK